MRKFSPVNTCDMNVLFTNVIANEKIHRDSTRYISDKIKKLRDECNWSQSKLAKEAGVTASAISMIESGQRAPSLIVIRKISDALKVSVSELTGESSQDEVAQHAQAFFRQFSDLEQPEMNLTRKIIRRVS